MAWTVILSPDAEKQLARLPRPHQKTLAGAIDRMRQDPFQGDVIPLKGEDWKGRYRKRVARYRLIFTADRTEQMVEISQILHRSEKTYRR